MAGAPASNSKPLTVSKSEISDSGLLNSQLYTADYKWQKVGKDVNKMEGRGHIYDTLAMCYNIRFIILGFLFYLKKNYFIYLFGTMKELRGDRSVNVGLD